MSVDFENMCNQFDGIDFVNYARNIDGSVIGLYSIIGICNATKERKIVHCSGDKDSVNCIYDDNFKSRENSNQHK